MTDNRCVVGLTKVKFTLWVQCSIVRKEIYTVVEG